MRMMSEAYYICLPWLRGGNTDVICVICSLTDKNLRYKLCLVGCLVQSSPSDRHVDRVYL